MGALIFFTDLLQCLLKCLNQYFSIARFLEYSLNAPDLSIPVVEGVAKVCFKCQGCREAKKFAENWSKCIVI